MQKEAKKPFNPSNFLASIASEPAAFRFGALRHKYEVPRKTFDNENLPPPMMKRSEENERQSHPMLSVAFDPIPQVRTLPKSVIATAAIPIHDTGIKEEKEFPVATATSAHSQSINIKWASMHAKHKQDEHESSAVLANPKFQSQMAPGKPSSRGFLARPAVRSKHRTPQPVVNYTPKSVLVDGFKHTGNSPSMGPKLNCYHISVFPKPPDTSVLSCLVKRSAPITLEPEATKNVHFDKHAPKSMKVDRQESEDQFDPPIDMILDDTIVTSLAEYDLRVLFGLKKPKMKVVRWKHDQCSDECLICRRKFSFSTRRHHCRLCGNLLYTKVNVDVATVLHFDLVF